MGEGDRRISLLQRLVAHAETTARYSIYYGEGRDAYDVPGRVAHESIFNLNDGSYRCPNSQQGYSPFSTWTRGLAWAILGYAEQLEFLRLSAAGQDPDRAERAQLARCVATFLRAATATADFTSLTAAPTASRCGTRARRTCIGWAITSTGPPIHSTRGSRWTAPPPPSPRRGWFGWEIIFRRGATRRTARGIARPG